MYFSIIVSIYKVEKYLRQCIESVLKQTYADFELLLIDDGSPDACPEICDEYAALDQRIRVIHKSNGGLMSTRKIGVSEAKGRYICFIDGDDFIDSDMLETYASVLGKDVVDIICAGYTRYFEPDGISIKYDQNIPYGCYGKKFLTDHVYPRMLSTPPFFTFYVLPSVCIKCFRSEIAKKVYENIPEDITIGEDAAASYPSLLKAESIAVIQYYGYFYRQNRLSMTHSYNNRLFEQIKNLIRHLKSVESDVDWNAQKQIDEYTLQLLTLARNNELEYNCFQNYWEKREKLLVYLNDDEFANAVKRVRVRGVKNRVVHWCFKYKIILPLYIWSRKTRRVNGVKNRNGAAK